MENQSRHSGTLSNAFTESCFIICIHWV